MPKRTIQDLCDLHKVSRDIITTAVTEGVNKWNDDEMREWIANRRPKMDSKASAPKETEAEAVDFEGKTLTECADILQAQLLRETNHREISALKNKILGVKELIKIKIESGELIPRHEVMEAQMMFATANRAAFIKQENDLPPRLVGLDEPAMQKIIREVNVGILEELSDRHSSFWDDRPTSE